MVIPPGETRVVPCHRARFSYVPVVPIEFKHGGDARLENRGLYPCIIATARAEACR